MEQGRHMYSIKRLLVATDFSEAAGLAVKRAAVLAAEQRADLELLYVMSGRSLQELRESFGTSTVAADLPHNAGNVLRDLAAAVAGQAKIKATSRVAVGNVLDELVSSSEQADVLILGAHGWNPLRDRILGTTAVRLLGKCACPALVAKCPPQGAYKRVLVPVDFSPHAAASLSMALTIAPDADIKIVHAFHVPFERMLMGAGIAAEEVHRYRNHARHQAVVNTDALIRGVGGDPHRFVRAIEQGRASQLIITEEAGFQADLIVIGKHGRSVVEEMLLGSVTRHVLSYSKCDVLVIPSPGTR